MLFVDKVYKRPTCQVGPELPKSNRCRKEGGGSTEMRKNLLESRNLTGSTEKKVIAAVAEIS